MRGLGTLAVNPLGGWMAFPLVGCRSDFDRYFRVPYGGQEEEFLWPTNTWLT